MNSNRFNRFYNALCPKFQPYDFKDKTQLISDTIDYFLSRTQKIFTYEGLPDTIPERELELMIQCAGVVAVARVSGSLYAFNGGLGGEPDEYYRPTLFTVANPALNFSGQLKINEECVLIPNDGAYIGLLPMLRKYASLLAENELSIKCAIINMRIKEIISAPDDTTKKSAERYLEKIEDGEVSVIGDNAFLDGVKIHPSAASVGQATITNLIEMEQYLKASLYNEIGVESNYNMKREAINSEESRLNADSLQPLIENMLDCRKLALEKINAMFGTNISVRLSSVWKQEESAQEDTEKEEEPEQKQEDKQEEQEGKDNGQADTE